MKNFLHIFSFLAVTLVGTFSFSQTYPVQTNTHLTGPFTNHIPDYLEPGNSKLQVALQITDVNVGVLHVRLKFKLTGPNGVIETKSTYAPPMITLNFGVPTMLDGADLANYFDASNLNFSNSQTQSLYTTNSNIQEGFWTWCVEVYDATNPTAEVLSTNSCPIVFISTNLPPLTNLPICGSTLAQAPTVLFTWTPMPSYLPSDAEVSYIFELFAIPIASFTNVAQIISMQPFFTIGLLSGTTSYLLNTNEVPLTSQFHYVWRVQVQNTYGNSGNITTNAYMNNGYSIPCEFMLENNDQIAINSLEIALTSEGTGISVGKSTWVVTDTENNNNNFDGFVLAYRKAGNPDYTWYEQNVTGSQYIITQLDDSTIYETKIKGYIGNEESDWTAIDTFITKRNPSFVCGDSDVPPLPTEFTPLPTVDAFPGIDIAQGQFSMKVTDIQPIAAGTPGHFKGTGRISIGFLLVTVRVSFDDLEVDDQYVAHSGVIMVITKGMDQWLSEQYLNNVTPIKVDSIFDGYGFSNDTTGFYVCDGDTIFFQVIAPLPSVYIDANGTTYEFWPDGSIIVKPYGKLSLDHLDVTAEKNIIFEEHPELLTTTSGFGFDALKYSAWKDKYEVIQGEDEYQYVVPYKSMGRVDTDVIFAKISVPYNSAVDALTFEITGNTTPLTYEPVPDNNSLFKITLPVGAGNYEVYAMFNGLKLGKLNVKSYDEITKKITIVPIATVTLNKTTIETALNTIYKPANVKFNVTIAEPYLSTVFSHSTIFLDPETNLMSRYTPEMRALRDEYLAAHPLEDENSLIFVIPGFEDNSIEGYMPLGLSYGFVKAGIPQFERVLAHELGHGIGSFQHSWNNQGPPEESTNNLMDYSIDFDNIHLIEEQWETFRTGGSDFNFWDEEEDGSSASPQVCWYKVYIDNTTNYKVISREFWKRMPYVKLLGNNNWVNAVSPIEYLSTPTVVNFICLASSHELITTTKRLNVVYYNNIWVNGKWVRYFSEDKNTITLTAPGATYDFPVHNVYTVQRYIVNDNVVLEKVFNYNGIQYNPATIAGNVAQKTNIHLQAVEFLRDYYRHQLSDISLNGGVRYATGYTTDEHGYDVKIRAFDYSAGTCDGCDPAAGYATLKFELLVHIDFSMSKADLNTLLLKYGVKVMSSLEYYLWHNGMKETLNHIGGYYDIVNTQPSWVANLVADVLMATGPSAIIGFVTGNHWRTGDTLTGWDHVFNTFELIPIGGALVKIGRHSLKGMKIYGTVGRVFDVFDAVNKIPYHVVTKVKTLNTQLFVLGGEYANKLTLVFKGGATPIRLANFNEEGMIIETAYSGGAGYDVIGDMGTISVLDNGVYVERKVKIVQNGNAVGVIVEGLDEIFDFLKFKNLTGVTPTGNKLTNIRKGEFLNFGYQIKPTSGQIKTWIDEMIINGDNLGERTEEIVDKILESSGYTKVNGKYGSNNGYDHIYVNGTENNFDDVIIIESKQFRYKNNKADDIIEHNGLTFNQPGTNTELPAQMKDAWIKYVADKLLDSTNPLDVAVGTRINYLLEFDRSKIYKFVAAVDKSKGEINFLKLNIY